MPHFFREVAVLQQEGKLHSRLVTRLRMLFGIAAILLVITLYNVFFAGADGLLTSVLAVVGLGLGFYVFSRMSRVQWNEEEEVVEASKMDRFGYAMIGLYVVFEIAARTVLTNYFAAGAEAYIFAVVFGVIFGRACGMVVEIHRVYKSTHGA